MYSGYPTRLPQIVVPKHYKLQINPDFEQRTFSGSVDITFEHKDTSQPIPNDILLHAQEPLVIEKVNQDDTLLKYKQLNNTLTIHGFVNISHPITIKFHGIINGPGQSFGFFMSDTFIVTQFESNFASTVFPCFDEPCNRSTFEISIIHPPSMQALSNMPLSSKSESDDQTISTFQTTPPIPTYLVCMAIGTFRNINGTSKSGIPINIYGNNIETCNNLLPLAIEAIDFMEEYTQIKFPLPKLDFVLVPRFVYGGMENNGLITVIDFGSYFPNYPTVIYHEVAHHWAGNLATIKWWDNIWIPEGLATLFPFLIAEKLNKESETGMTHFSTIYRRMFENNETSPNALPLEHFSFEKNAFNESMYFKGYFIFQSIKKWCGDEAFQKSLQTFFHKFSYSNFDANDFIECFPEKVKIIFHSFLNQSSFPVAILEENGTAYLKPFIHRNLTSIQKEKAHQKSFHLPLKILFGKDDNLIEKDYILGPEPIMLEEAKDADFVILNYQDFTICKTYLIGKWNDG